jgi:hypothetical protein
MNNVDILRTAGGGFISSCVASVASGIYHFDFQLQSIVQTEKILQAMNRLRE